MRTFFVRYVTFFAHVSIMPTTTTTKTTTTAKTTTINNNKASFRTFEHSSNVNKIMSKLVSKKF